MKKAFIFLIIGVVIVVAAITNPDVSRHREKLRKKITENVAQKMTGNGAGASVLASAFGNAMINRLVENLVTADNYIVFSLTKITWKGDSKVVGVGAFGNVFLTGKIDDAFENQSLLEE